MKIIHIPQSENPADAIFAAWFRSLNNSMALEEARLMFQNTISNSKLVPHDAIDNNTGHYA